MSAVAIPANPDALALGLKSGAITRSDLQATLDLLRVLVGKLSPQANPQSNEWLDLAREFRRVMQRA